MPSPRLLFLSWMVEPWLGSRSQPWWTLTWCSCRWSCCCCCCWHQRNARAGEAFSENCENSFQAQRIFEVVDRKPKIDCNASAGLKLNAIKGNIDLKEARFSYPTRWQSCIKQIIFFVSDLMCPFSDLLAWTYSQEKRYLQILLSQCTPHLKHLNDCHYKWYLKINSRLRLLGSQGVESLLWFNWSRFAVRLIILSKSCLVFFMAHFFYANCSIF